MEAQEEEEEEEKGRDCTRRGIVPYFPFEKRLAEEEEQGSCFFCNRRKT